MEEDDAQLRTYQEAFERPSHVDLIVGPGLESHNRRFGDLLGCLREHAGLSRADAAAKLGFSAEYLRLIEIGRRTPALGQMRNFLHAYGAEGEVERVMRGGDRPDLIVIDPLNGEVVLVEFKSRIREARRNTSTSPSGMRGGRKDLDLQEWDYGGPSPSRAAELGVVVSLLAQVDDDTIRRIRQILEGEIGKRADN